MDDLLIIEPGTKVKNIVTIFDIKDIKGEFNDYTKEKVYLLIETIWALQDRRNSFFLIRDRLMQLNFGSH